MKKLLVPEDTNNITIGGDEFTPGADGTIEVPESHAQSAMQLGCTDPDSAPVIPVAPTIPHEAKDDAIAALIAENEDLKRDLEDLTKERDDALASLEKATEALEALQAGTGAPEGGEGPGGASPGAGDGSAPLERLPDEQPTFSDAEAFTRDGLRDWLTGRGVATPGNISRDGAEKIAVDIYAEQKAAQDVLDAAVKPE